jgi:hypothetical protein
LSNKEKLSIDHIQRVIELCKSVDEQGVDPFSLDIDEIITTLQQYFPEWESPEEMAIDAEAVQCLASVIQNQGNWVKYRSTSLYTDPFLLEDKINRLKKEDFIEVFTKVWTPVIEMEQLSISYLAEAMKYWDSLVPIAERWQNDDPLEVQTGFITREELVREKILAKKTFMDDLVASWDQLKQKVGEKKKILYWDFIGCNTYNETLDRAYMTSFLVTYGYATLELHPLDEEVFIIPFTKPRLEMSDRHLVSVPISISFDEWISWKEGKLNDQKSLL